MVAHRTLTVTASEDVQIC